MLDTRGQTDKTRERRAEDMSFVRREGIVKNIGIFVAWPYCNGPRHVGHGAALVPADVAARYFRASQDNVLMVSGTDEYGTPNMVAAEKKGVPTQDFVDQTSAIIRSDFIGLGMTYDWFTRTTSPNHIETAQGFFENLVDSGYISEGEMLGSYDSVTAGALADRYVEGNCPKCHEPGARGDQCDSCTTLLDPSELIDPRSSITGNTVEFKPVKHYFLNLDKLKDEVADFVGGNENLRREAKKMSANLVTELRPRAITRDIPWGIPLPKGYELGEDDSRVLYVWFEAVIGYLSASIEWAKEQGDEELWKTWWTRDNVKSYYFMGKDNVPFHTIIWPALISAKNHDVREGEVALAYPDIVASTGNLNFNGDKFSTSRGNVAYIRDMLDIVGPDALRFYLILSGPENRDTNFSLEELVTRTNTELVAKWGNLVSRTTNLIQRDCEGVVPDRRDTQEVDDKLLEGVREAYLQVGASIEQGKFSQALKSAIDVLALANKYIVDEQPWRADVVESGRAREVLATLSIFIENMTTIMVPFIPHSSQRISDAFGSTQRVAPMPHLAQSNAMVDVLTTADPVGDARWCYTEQWPGNRLTSGKAVVFAKLDVNKVTEEFDAIQSARKPKQA